MSTISSKVFSISQQDLFYQLKLSCKIPTIAEEIIARKVITATAEELSIKVTTTELQQAADQIRLLHRLQMADHTWNWLQRHHLSLDEFEEIAYFNAIASKLAHHLFAEQVELFFAEHILDYTQVVFYEVMLEDEDLALELFYAIQEGETSFRDVAAQYAQDAEQRRTGGYRGRVARTQLKPELSAAVFTANPPQLLKPIVTPQGTHLLFVEEFISPQLDDLMRQRILSDLFGNWLKQAIDQVEVVVSL